MTAVNGNQVNDGHLFCFRCVRVRVTNPCLFLDYSIRLTDGCVLGPRHICRQKRSINYSLLDGVTARARGPVPVADQTTTKTLLLTTLIGDLVVSQTT